ncbi:MAG: class I SAM-dependent methyltransferase [Bacilli bacterium]
MINIKISKRLEAVAKLIDKDASIIDVGCDHALLDIYLVLNKMVEKAIATDVTIGALKQASKNISFYNLDKVIDTRLGDGITVLNDNDKVNTIVISGLGFQKIINILEDSKEKLTNTIIIQSNNGVDLVRNKMMKLGYSIVKECMVKENDIIYTVIKFFKSKKRLSNKEIFFGPWLLNHKDDLFYEYYDELLNTTISIYNRIPIKNHLKKIEFARKIRQIRKEIL